MTVGKAAERLREMYDEAPEGERVTSIHLFGIKYADEIGSMPLQELVDRAGLPSSYPREISKMIKLAKYVKLRQSDTCG